MNNLLDGGTHRRVLALLRLLSSNVLGERAAAAEALARIADERGFDWEDVVPSQSAFDDAVEAAIADAVASTPKPQQRGQPTQRTACPDDAVLKRIALEILEERPADLSAKERAFFTAIQEWRGPLSDPQRKWVCDVAARLGAEVFA